MQTRLPASYLDTVDGRLAESILRSCVHCGFCTATCPTFLQTGNELDSPRGRIYLIKEMLENDSASAITRTHLDRCLACQSCETTCPSNVQYHTLLDIGRTRLAGLTRRGWPGRMKRALLLSVLGSSWLFAVAVCLGRLFRFMLPRSLVRQLPGPSHLPAPPPQAGASRQVVLLQGCVQKSLSPDTSKASAIVLAKLGIGSRFIAGESCCGAMHYHSDACQTGLHRARQLIDQVSQALDDGAEAVISSASGCGNFIKDYATLFRHDEAYLDKARRVAASTRDIGEFLQREDLESLNLPGNGTLAFHSPCTLQHGQQLAGVVEEVLVRTGFTVPAVKDTHLCCGSAGTYSLFQPAMARTLGREKVLALEKVMGEGIATANIGCQCHLARATTLPVKHWIEYLAQALSGDT